MNNQSLTSRHQITLVMWTCRWNQKIIMTADQLFKKVIRSWLFDFALTSLYEFSTDFRKQFGVRGFEIQVCVNAASSVLTRCDIFLFPKQQISLTLNIWGCDEHYNKSTGAASHQKRIFRNASAIEKFTGIMPRRLFGGKKLTFHSLFISVLINTASALILFKHSSGFEENKRFIHCSFLLW